eukprot:10557665-Karenia_brevis.AAC.1
MKLGQPVHFLASVADGGRKLVHGHFVFEDDDEALIVFEAGALDCASKLKVADTLLEGFGSR